MYRIVAEAQLAGMPSVTEQAWNPTHYDRAGAFVPKLAADLIELLAPEPGQRVLDLGAGTGDLTQALAAAGARPLGLDASQAMVSEARRKHPNLDFVVGDGQELSFDGEFDAVFSNATLHWMARAEDVARGVARALKPGGRFVAEFGGARCVRTVRNAVQAELAELGVEGHGTPSWYFPTVAQYARVLDDAGLFARSLLWFERPTRLEGEAGLENWLELFCLPLLRALGDRRAALVSGVQRRCRAALFRDGGWWLDYTRLRVVATKP
ncbi:MAG TPA: methyltransferase domain-containing protein [Polyangiaceae bacterium]|nr:methyltransferase domain-containing protein [Polyangiaceae bacterium]